jgi:nucleoside-specific outer membrane channel protein Tsx
VNSVSLPTNRVDNYLNLHYISGTYLIPSFNELHRITSNQIHRHEDVPYWLGYNLQFVNQGTYQIRYSATFSSTGWGGTE